MWSKIIGSFLSVDALSFLISDELSWLSLVSVLINENIYAEKSGGGGGSKSGWLRRLRRKRHWPFGNSDKSEKVEIGGKIRGGSGAANAVKSADAAVT